MKLLDGVWKYIKIFIILTKKLIHFGNDASNMAILGFLHDIDLLFMVNDLPSSY